MIIFIKIDLIDFIKPLKSILLIILKYIDLVKKI